MVKLETILIKYYHQQKHKEICLQINRLLNTDPFSTTPLNQTIQQDGMLITISAYGHGDYVQPEFSESMIEFNVTIEKQGEQKGQKITLSRIEATISYPALESDLVYCNGFQSWTDSKEFSRYESMPRLNSIAALAKMPQYGDYSFINYNGKKGHLHSFHYTYIRPESADNSKSNILLFASMHEQSGYTIFQHRPAWPQLSIQKECQGTILSEIGQVFYGLKVLIGQGPEHDLFGIYLKRFQDNYAVRTREQPQTGWTSWYYHYTNISEQIINKNLDEFASREIPIDIFQIDDGYQRYVGDWLEINDKFASGMESIARKIKDKGYRAGLWLAPFICEKKSSIYANNQDWLVSYEGGGLVKAGWNPLWSGNFFALDIYNQDFRQYLKRVFRTILRNWHFDMVKLDFLYAAAIIPRQGKNRGQIMSDAMHFLRECVGDKAILGCGVPLGSAFGLVDYCRIGSDVALKWEDTLLNKIHYRERVSTLNSLRSTIGRWHLNGRAFLNDPDVFILRSEKNKLSSFQKHSLFLLNQLFGNLVFTSDDIGRYDQKTMALYRMQFPFLKKDIHKVHKLTRDGDIYFVRFAIANINYILISNLDSRRYSYQSDEHWYYNHKRQFIAPGSQIALQSFETLCLQQIPKGQVALAGSPSHLFPCSDIEEFKVTDHHIRLSQRKHANKGAKYFIRVPEQKKYLVNYSPLSPKAIAEDFLIIEYHS